MNGWILYVGEPVPELRRAAEEAAKSKLQIELVDPKEVDLILDPDATQVFLRGVPVAIPDFAIAAFIGAVDYYNLALLRHLEVLGVLCVNPARTLQNTGDKLKTHHLLAAAGIPTPRTLLLHRGMTSADVLRHFEPLLVLKIVDGSKGKNVELIRDRQALEHRLAEYRDCPPEQEWLAQEFIEQSSGRDVRVLVIDRKPAAAMLRQGAAGEFKSNFSLGGSVSAWPLTEPIQALARRVIDALELNMGGIDLLLNGDDFLVCEVNSMPGFQGIEKCTDLNVPQALLRGIGRQLAVKPKSRFQMRAFLENPGSASICERLAGQTDANMLNFFLGLCEDPVAVQLAVLHDILRINAGCERGQALGFSEIDTVEVFRARTPITQWDDYAADVKRMEEGAKDVLFAGETKHFLLTSGSTGPAKYVPENERGAQAKAVTTRLRNTVTFLRNPGLLEGAILPLTNSPSWGATAAGIPVGTASGLTLAAVPESLKKRLAYPLECFAITDPEALEQTLIRFALEQDVRLLITNNAARAGYFFSNVSAGAPGFIDAIERGILGEQIDLPAELRAKLEASLKPNPTRAAELRSLLAEGNFLPRHYWPRLSLLSCWLAGSVGRFTAAIRPSLPEKCEFLDCGYGASEGKFNIPLRPGTAAGPLAIHAGFYEFLPLDGGAPLLAHEVQDQTSYQLLLTTFSGLYRYNIHDIVRVDGFTGRTPNLHFETKSGEVANIGGEKLSPTIVMQAFDALPAEDRAAIHHYALLEGRTDHHWLCVEPKEGAADLDIDRIGARFEKALQEVSIVYQGVRSQCRVQACQAVLLRPGWQASLYARRVAPGQSTAQVKLPVILREDLDESFVLRRTGG